jgi:tetratricopeptide (TPR) repeat protein
MAALAAPSADEQFAAAFRAWGLDVNGVAPAEAVVQLKARPAGVVTEVIAALDEWAGERRADRVLEAKDPAEWRRRVQRVMDLAAALDDPGSRQAELRAMLARGSLEQERALRALSAALRPVPVPFDAAPGEDRRHLRLLVAQTDVATEPVLGILTLARALRAAGDDVLAERVLKAAVQARPQEVVLQRALGVLLAARQRWAEAAACYAAARALRPEFGVALAEALRKSGHVEEGLALNERLVRDRPDEPWLHLQRGYALAQEGRYREAEAAYREAIQRKPDDPYAHSSLAGGLGLQGRFKEAEAECSEAIRLKPDLPEARYNLSGALGSQRRYKEAEAACREAIRLKPDYPDAYTNLSAELSGQGRFKEAEVAGREAVRLKPDFPRAHYNLGVALRAQARFREAEVEYRETIRLAPEYGLAHTNLGNVLLMQDRFREAEAPCREGIRLGLRPGDISAEPDVHMAYCMLSLALTGQGRPKDGETAIREALRLRPDYAAAHCYLGFALRDQGRFQEALEAMRRGHVLGSKEPGWSNPSADWVRECERLVELDGRLPTLLRGGAEPASPAERAEFASLCHQYKRLQVAATGAYAAAFAAEPKLAEDWRGQHRYSAACSAALGAAGQGEDAKNLPDKERQMLRRQALQWLRNDLTLYAQLAKRPEPVAQQFVRERIAHWQQDADLDTVRDPAVLDQLRDDERLPWRHLWDDVAALLKQVEQKK